MVSWSTDPIRVACDRCRESRGWDIQNGHHFEMASLRVPDERADGEHDARLRAGPFGRDLTLTPGTLPDTAPC